MSETAKKTIVRAAVVQASSVLLNQEACVEKLRILVKEASENGANLVVFPEAFISGYPRGTNFGAVCGQRSKEGREKFKQFWDSAIEVPGPVVEQLGKIAKTYQVVLVVGITERDGGTLYCTVIYFAENGEYLGKHRKLVPTASERIFWGQGDGSTIPVLKTSVGKIGGAICWENYMALLRVALYSKGIEIYIAPTADAREEWTSTMRHIALEGRCFVLGCNQFTKFSDYPSGFIDTPSKTSEDDVFCKGGSVIISPLGEILAGPNFESEIILYANLDLEEIPRAKMDFDPVGHYARPDVFTLHVNENANESVVRVGHPSKTVVGSTPCHHQFQHGQFPHHHHHHHHS